MIDSHCHLDRLDLTAYPDNAMDVIIKEAQENGVDKIVSVSVALLEVPVLRALSEKYDLVYHSVGVHPSEFTSPPGTSTPTPSPYPLTFVLPYLKSK